MRRKHILDPGAPTPLTGLRTVLCANTFHLKDDS
jgi:hypothetical protein